MIIMIHNSTKPHIAALHIRYTLLLSDLKLKYETIPTHVQNPYNTIVKQIGLDQFGIELAQLQNTASRRDRMVKLEELNRRFDHMCSTLAHFHVHEK